MLQFNGNGKLVVNMGTVDKAVREEFQKEVEGLQKKQKEIQKCVQAREKLEAQLTENKVVKEELDLLEVCFYAEFHNMYFVDVLHWLYLNKNIRKIV